jgi:hypothetical protein
MTAAAFSPKRDKKFLMYMSQELHSALEKCSSVENRSMAEIVHLGAELLVKRLQKRHKKEGK